MAELHIVGCRYLWVLRFRYRLFSQDAVDAFYTLIDVARVASQECQFIDGRSHTRTHDDEKQPYHRQRHGLRTGLHQQDAHRENERHHRIEQNRKGNHSVLISIAALQGKGLICLDFGIELTERTDTLPEYLDHGHPPHILHGRRAHLFLRIVVDAHKLPCPLAHEIRELKKQTDHYNR